MFDFYGNVSFWVAIAVSIVVIIVIFKTAVVVPQQTAVVIESLGKYSRTLRAGFHILIPFIESAAYRNSLKELAIDIPEHGFKPREGTTEGLSSGGRARRPGLWL